MKKVKLTRGIPGSGKSTWAKEQLHKYPGRYKRINRDALRLMFDDEQFNPKREKFITIMEKQLILSALEEGFHVIVDDCNLNPKYVNQFKELVKGKATVEIIDFTHIPLETCIKQDLKRLASVGKDVITDMYNAYLKPKILPITYDPHLVDIIICDLDGTLSLMNGKRGAFEWKKCIHDDINEPVKDILQRYSELSVPIYLFSGRSDVSKDETIQWLKNHSIGYDLLDMRKDGDDRSDTIVKKEMYEKHVKDKYNVLFVLDDRAKIVEQWRSLGLTCLQVAEGNF
jgi:predicted kinase